MKHLRRLAAAALATAFAVALAGAAPSSAGPTEGEQDKKPVNKMCPVQTDHKVDVEVTVIYKGKVIGLCCTACAKKWGNGAAYEKNIKEDFGAPDLPEGADNVKAAVDGGKAGGYMVAALFADKTPKTEAFMKLFLDATVNPEILNCAFAKVPFVKDSPEAKLYKVSAAPTLLLIDPTKEPPAVLKTITTATPKTLLKDIQEAREKVGK
ncbi:MAG: hypothetical protein HY293_08205 [Planctomycetes bacterium]|nr:hypothetical protein [Planctomycetota bacterium]